MRQDGEEMIEFVAVHATEGERSKCRGVAEDERFLRFEERHLRSSQVDGRDRNSTKLDVKTG